MKKMRGFTLIELLVSVGIATVIIAAGMPMFTSRSAKARTLQNDQNALAAFVDRARNYAVNNESETTRGVKGYAIQVETVGTDKKKLALYKVDQESHPPGGVLSPIGFTSSQVDTIMLSGTKITSSASLFYFKSPNGNFVQQGSGTPYKEIKLELVNDPSFNKIVSIKTNGSTKD